ncbi:MAG: PorT family protein [Sphingobacteriales bacterium]|nr:PorT family protein [Sphingobacteriales bacterium]
MNKDLHDIDNLFYAALETTTEMPSAAVRKKLIAALDKKDAESNRKKFIWWRKTALLLILLLAGLVLFETKILKTGHDTGTKKTFLKKPSPSSEKNSDQQQIISGKQINNGPGTDIAAGIKKEKEALQFLDYSSPIYLLKTVSTHHPQSTQPVTFWNSDDTETLLKYDGTETNRQLSYPVSLTDRTSKKIFLLQHKPMVFAPGIVSEKSPGSIFRPYWQFSIFTSYEQAGYKLDSDDKIAVSNIKHNEVPEPSFSGGILATRQFSKHWGLQTGLYYSFTGIGISPQKIYAFQDPTGNIAYKYITSSGYVYLKPSFSSPPAFGDSLTAESKHTLQSIHIPVMATYKLGKNKLTILPAAGIDAGLVTRARTEVELTDASSYEKTTIHKLSGTKKFYWSAAASVEIQYKLNRKTSLTLQPVLRHAFSPITENNVVETFPRSFGLRVGMVIKL